VPEALKNPDHTDANLREHQVDEARDEQGYFQCQKRKGLAANLKGSSGGSIVFSCGRTGETRFKSNAQVFCWAYRADWSLRRGNGRDCE
jgi:hypothetical protein